jgi:hypothetical protein
MSSRQIVLLSTAGFSVLNTGIFWREAKTKRLFSQCACTQYKQILVEIMLTSSDCVDTQYTHSEASLVPSPRIESELLDSAYIESTRNNQYFAC